MTGRPSFRQRGYSSEWDQLAARFLRESPFCWGCLSIGVETPASLLDHVIPAVDAPQRFLDVENLQPLCRHCHDVVKRTLERRWKAGEISAADMRMGSRVAVAEVKRRHVPAVGVDGFPVEGT